jgi:hypothetical protein
MQLQRLQNRLLLAVGNLVRCTPVPELRVVSRIPYVYDYVIKLCRTQAEVILKLVISNVRRTRQGETRHRKY